MPTSLEELERKFDALTAENATLKRRITDLEESVDSHVGIDYGATQQLSPHPNQQIQTAEYGGGISRLDSTGIQFNAPVATTKRVYWLDGFKEAPQSAYPRSEINGSSSPTPEMEINTYGGNGTDYSQLYIGQLVSYNEAFLTCHLGSDYTTLYQYIDASDAYVGVRPQIEFAWLSSDPTAGEGRIWYRSDIDRLRVRANGITRNFTMDGTNTTLTIASGAVAATTSFHAIDTESAGASDDLDTITGGQTGQVLYIHAANGARDVVAKDGTGNLKLAGDFTMNNTEDVLTLIYDGANWLELSRSDNGA